MNVTLQPARAHRMRAGWLLAALLVSGALVWAQPSAQAQSLNLMRSITGQLTRTPLHSVRTVIRPTLAIVRDRAGPVVGLHPSEDGRFLLAVLADGTARLWDLKRGRQLGEGLAKGVVAGVFNHRGTGPEFIAIRADGSLVTVRPDGRVRPTGRRLERLDPGVAPVLSADASTVAYRTREGGWRWMEWRQGRARPLPDVARGSRPVLSYDGAKVTYRTTRGGRVVRDARDEARGGAVALGGCARKVEVTAAMFTPDASRVVLGDGRGNLCVRSLSRSAAPRRLFVKKAMSGAIRTLAIDREGARVALAGEDSRIAVWSLASRARVASFETGVAPGSSHPLLLDSGRGWLLAGGVAGTIGLWSIQEQARIARLISMRRGWAVVDRRGRFDGSRNGVDTLVWAAKEQTLPVDAFSERYFEPGLLAKLDDAAPLYLNEDVRDISEDGYVAPPVVTLDPLALGDADAEGRLPVTVRIVGRAPERGVELRLYHNGKLAPARYAVADSRPGVARYRIPLLPGENTFEAIGVGAGGVEGRPASASITAPGRASRTASMHVVAVGVNEYLVPAWKLDYSRNDAEAIVRTLRERAGRLFRDVDTATLLDASASVFDIENHLLRAFPSDRDVLVVYLAGHGYALREGEGWEWYFLPFTNAWRGAARQGEGISASARADLIRRHGLSSRKLMQVLTAAGPRRVFLILDSCRSGAAVEALSGSGAAELDDAVSQKSLRRLGRVGGIHVLAAARTNEDAVELDREPHGALTYLVLEGIRDGTADADRDERISVREIIDYAAREMSLLSQRLFDQQSISQKPVGYSRGSDFALAGV